jgi:hypothetical protein
MFSRMTELELLRAAVKCNAQLWQAVQITLKAVSLGLPFPIESEEALLNGFGPPEVTHLRLQDVSFSKDQVRKFFPAAFYPIRDEEDMLGKMFAALHHGRNVHELEAQLMASRKQMHLNGVAR